MTHTETLNLLEEIESLVSDQLQVVSYKWVTRNFSISSETAKRLLKEFVEKHENGLEVVYTVSGWLKNKPSDYLTRLVSSSQLPVVEKEFNGTCSVHVYSVQSSIPKDTVAIWNSEFVQAEELFKQPSDTDNCLRDNSFCSISNSFVKRNIEGATGTVTTPTKQGNKFQQPVPKVGYQGKSEAITAPAQNQPVKSSSDKLKHVPAPANKKNGQGEKSVTGNGGSLKNMWGRVPVKTEDNSATIEVKEQEYIEPQKPSHGADNKGGSDDETGDVDFRRASKNDNRKRKVIFDFSDEECEDVISLVSPSSPKLDSLPDSEETKDPEPEKPDTSREIKMEETDVSKEDRQTTASTDKTRKDEKSVASSLEKNQGIGFEAEVNILKGRKPDAPSSPKRKKVLKTRIDDRGREVTEVVWEEPETNLKKKEETVTSKKLNDGKSANASNRAFPQKSPAIGNTASSTAGGKAGSKKGGKVKDPKQGNIMSFFKKV